MGKGDRKSARGKRIMGSSGVTRKRKKTKYVAPVPEAKAAPKVETKKEAAPKPAAKKPAAKKATKKSES
jgi:ribosomal small subunit protein bTHX